MLLLIPSSDHGFTSCPLDAWITYFTTGLKPGACTLYFALRFTCLSASMALSRGCRPGLAQILSRDTKPAHACFWYTAWPVPVSEIRWADSACAHAPKSWMSTGYLIRHLSHACRRDVQGYRGKHTSCSGQASSGALVDDTCRCTSLFQVVRRDLVEGRGVSR